MLWIFILFLGILLVLQQLFPGEQCSLDYSRAVLGFFKGCFAPGERHYLSPED